MTQLQLLTAMLGDEPARSSRRRKALGQVFTPAAIVEFVLDHADYNANTQVLARTVLEPSCGDGAFLLGAARRIADAVDADAASVSAKARAERLAKVLQTRLWGLDIDARAAGAARDAMSRFFAARTGRPPPDAFFSANIVVGDYLSDARLDDLRSRVAEFDLVFGNPPYVATSELSDAFKDELRGRFVTASGRIDLYGIFIERSIGLLGDGGILSFIVPDKFLQSQTARPLRRLLIERGAVTSIARFDSHKVFDAAATVPCVFVFERARAAETFQSLECDYINGTTPGRVVIKRTELLPANRLRAEAWRTKGSDLESLAERITQNHPLLGSLASRVSAGLATGRDSVFVVDQATARSLDRELLRPAVRGRDLGPLSVAKSGLSILVPFRFNKNKPELIDINKYPKTHAYLRSFRRELNARHCVRTWEKAWYDIHDPVSDDVARLPKVLVPDVADAPRFVFEEGKYCPLHSAYYIVPRAVHGEYLAAVLNSKPIEFLIRLRAPVVKDGFNRYRRQFLVDLPIPIVDEWAQQKIVAAARMRDFNTIDATVCDLFRLTREELCAMEDYIDSVRYRRKAKEPRLDLTA